MTIGARKESDASAFDDRSPENLRPDLGQRGYELCSVSHPPVMPTLSRIQNKSRKCSIAQDGG
jgi:hypothetical protein